MQQSDGNTRAERFTEAVTEWQRRLLQLDRSNNLLYFPGRATVLRIAEQTADGITEALLSSPQGLAFDYAEPRSGRRGRRRDQADAEPDETPEPYVVSGKLRGECPPLDLQRRLSILRRRAREWREEQGLNVLFLALGFLEWIDEAGEKATAPLLLLPCQLDRPSPRDAFTLLPDDDVLSTNSTLAIKLQEFGIDLSEAGSETETAGEYLDAVRGLLAGKPDWAVHDDVYLATFAYSKLAMWRDLDLVKSKGTENPIVLTLAGADQPEEAGGIASPFATGVPEDLSGGRLDDVLDVRDQFTVLPADYSQLLSITHARSGQNLVVHGPPGTGKSQTIANIIATLLAEGKSVLFVSEKTAALDVVKRRLDEKELGAFCLDLHSERGSKTSVYQQLQESVDDPRAVRNLNFDYAALAERRGHLNRLVRALHQVQEPFGRTVFQVHGRFAGLRDAPHVEFPVRDIAALDQGRLASILEAANRVSLRKREFQEHWTSHWRVLKEATPSLQLANTIRQDMRLVGEAVEGVLTGVPAPAQVLGLPAPETIEEITRLEEIAGHLAKASGVPAAWLKEGAAGRLMKVAERQSDIQEARLRLLEQVTPVFGSPVPVWDYAALAEDLTVPEGERRTLSTVLGAEWAKVIVRNRQGTSASLDRIKASLEEVQTTGANAAEFLGVIAPQDWPEVDRLGGLVEAICRLGTVPDEWLEEEESGVVEGWLDQARETARRLDEAEGRVLAEFEPGVLEVVDRPMLTRYRTDHQSRWRRLIASAYRADRKSLQAYRHQPGKMTFDRELEAVQGIVRTRELQSRWDEVAASIGPLLGRRFQGRKTDWEAVRQELDEVRKLCQEWPGKPGRLEAVLGNEKEVQRCRDLQRAMGDAGSALTGLLESWVASDPREQFYAGGEPLSAVGQLLGDAALPVRRLETAAGEPLARAQQEIEDVDALQELVEAGARLVTLEREHEQARSGLRADFGERFQGFDTDWKDIRAALDWTTTLVGLLRAEPSADFLGHVETPGEPQVYRKVAGSCAEIVQEFRHQTEPLRQRYDLDGGPWQAWECAAFGDVELWAQTLAGDADSASDWLRYRDTAAELDMVTGESATGQIRNETDNSEMVPRIVERRLLGAWLDQIYQQEPVLASFSASEQEDLIARFKELDEQLVEAARTEVRRRVFQRYPNVYATSNRANELSILRGELAKKRKQWPVRRLFGRIPLLVQALKPCFLVSPLAVSQYLPLSDLASETLSFDVVIFDEASQVFPEDAVPAILRGKQLVLAGDRKQLPPSSFFRRSAGDNDADYDDTGDDGSNSFEGIESILDEGVKWAGRLFREAHLNVHYRSRDESLIRFSNTYFYTPPGLLTFPSPGVSDDWHGVHGVYLPDGRYDAGTSRTNRVEAERVVDLVFQHMRTRPLEETIGVVALSRAQADLIERLIDERRILERDVDARFSESTEEPFFVKNLENVQGDERDHIIISVGYGPTVESGVVPNRFGPLNVTGGERRLNVVVTRARQRVDLVYSLRPTDIHSQQEGARLLRRYLEYVEDPLQAIEGQVTINSSSEPESPFEEAVERALLARGYRVARQVGVAGYRIDLAVLSEDGSRYDLGIECDGSTYHSAPAARDRDWLRQQVLEGLGWRVHRVWSTAWVRNPEGELARIETALALARAGTGIRSEEGSSDVSNSPASSVSLEDPPTVEIVSSGPDQVQLEEYQEVELPRRPRWAQLQSDTTEILVELLARVTQVEGPVHKDVVVERIRTCYGNGRVAGRARDRLDDALEAAQRNGEVRSDGAFIWANDDQLARPPRQPVDGDIEHVPPTELKAVILETARVMFGTARQDLVVEAARNLGFGRTGSRIFEVIDAAIQDLLDGGKLVESFGMLRPAQ